MPCPLCRKRPAKRSCPALRQDICPVCCATKRRVEINCPADCAYLDAALKHPAATIKRQLDRDLPVLMATLGRVSEPQLQLFFLFQTVILNHKPDGLARMVDSDVALATGALAGSLETAARGVIFDETTASLVAEGLRRAIKPLIGEMTQEGGSRAEREVAQVLRGIERGARRGPDIGPDDTSYLALVARVLRHQGPTGGEAPKPPLIIAP